MRSVPPLDRARRSRSSASSSSCRRRSGRGSRTPRRGWTSRSIPSTATRSPKRLTRPRAWIMAPFSLTAPNLPMPVGPPFASLRRRARSGRSAPARSRTPARRGAAPTARRRAGVRRGRPRSRAGAARSGALAAVVRVRADRDRGPVVERGAGVDPVRGHEQLRLDREVRRRVSERAAALVAADDDPVQLRQAARAGAPPPHLARVQVPPDLGRRDARPAAAPAARRSPSRSSSSRSPRRCGRSGSPRAGDRRPQRPPSCSRGELLRLLLRHARA